MESHEAPSEVREGVRSGIMGALERDAEMRGGRTARLLVAAGALGIFGAVGMIRMLSGHPYGHHPASHVVIFSAIWSGLLVVALALAFLQVRTPSLPLARAACLGGSRPRDRRALRRVLPRPALPPLVGDHFCGRRSSRARRAPAQRALLRRRNNSCLRHCGSDRRGRRPKARADSTAAARRHAARAARAGRRASGVRQLLRSPPRVARRNRSRRVCRGRARNRGTRPPRTASANAPALRLRAAIATAQRLLALPSLRAQ